jgi:HD-GYP domain-containing protein (c-di-GMP phosphodiesterase class II)
LGLGDRELSDVTTAAQIYDIGKSEIPVRVLHKPATLDDAELKVMRDGPIIAARVVAAVDSLSSLAPVVRAVHERWDGTGYPDGLAGAQIPTAARVIAVADAYHAMIADRPYREAFDPDAALAELHRNAGGQFWPAAVTALSSVLQP